MLGPVRKAMAAAASFSAAQSLISAAYHCDDYFAFLILRAIASRMQGPACAGRHADKECKIVYPISEFVWQRLIG
jgi:hypothetical protein